jgi:hypothetical protein
MSVRKQCLGRAALVALSAIGLGFANRAQAAVVTYNFDVNGSTTGFGVTTGSTYDWDSTTNGGFWSNNGTSTTGNIATNGWVQANFPKFQPASTPTYTITVSNNEQITGIFASTAQTLAINPIGSGGLEVVSGTDGFLGSSSANVTITAPIKGAGQINPSNGGNLFLNASNSYTGGTLFNSSSTLVHFNNGNAFGTGAITITEASGSVAPLLASGGATLTVPNDFTNTSSGGGVNFAADANTPLISTGNWSMGANNLTIKNNTPSSPVTLSGKISGTANLTLISTNGGTVTLSGSNSYSGTTTVGTSGNALITLKLGTSGAIASSSSLVLAGGTLNPGGMDQIMGSTTLGLTASSIITYVSGGSEVDFANSSALTWTAGKILNLTNFDPSVDKLRFGTDTTGLTASQLAEIEFNGSSLGAAQLDPNGYVLAAPEPSSAVLFLTGSLLFNRRRKR